MMLRNQNNRCTICGKYFTSRLRPRMDHNHETNEIRDLLCNCCNLLIGCAYENIEILEGAIRYLKRFQQ